MCAWLRRARALGDFVTFERRVLKLLNLPLQRVAPEWGPLGQELATHCVTRPESEVPSSDAMVERYRVKPTGIIARRRPPVR